jgi:hypothetical protein
MDGKIARCSINMSPHKDHVCAGHGTVQSTLCQTTFCHAGSHGVIAIDPARAPTCSLAALTLQMLLMLVCRPWRSAVAI